MGGSGLIVGGDGASALVLVPADPRCTHRECRDDLSDVVLLRAEVSPHAPELGGCGKQGRRRMPSRLS